MDPAVLLARARLALATGEPDPDHLGLGVDELEALVAADAAGEEWAEVVDVVPQWDPGAPLPHLLASDYRLALVYLVHRRDPAWDGSTVTVKDPASGANESLAIVTFHGANLRLGGPNDEVLHGHPLFGKGLQCYRAHVVHHSRWIEGQRAMNQVHHRYDPARWLDFRHYLFAFHDSTIEVMARSLHVTTRNAPFRSVLHEVTDSLLDG